MKRSIMILAAVICATLVTAQGVIYTPATSARVTKTINTEWTFNYFADPESENGGYEAPGFDDSKWPNISVPHTWQTYETTGELHPYIRNAAAGDNPYWWNGWGWYRKRIEIGKQHDGSSVFFEFDGVQKYSKVWLNGVYLGEHKGGFTSFSVDATEAVRFGGENILVVAVNNSLNDRDRIPPMNAGNWDVYGGIVRDVRVLVTDRLHVPFQGSAFHEGGMRITTPEVSDARATVALTSWVRNAYAKDRKVTLETIVTDADGREVFRTKVKNSVKPGEIMEFAAKPVEVRSPHLWGPEIPYLYNAYTLVWDGKRLADTYHTTFGIRSVSWDYDAHRLVLNGRITHLHGINRHEEYPWVGQAFPKWVAQRDMEDMAHGLEINYMRTAHYPNDPSVYYFMDSHGICINEELPNIKNQDFNTEVQELNCREMIRRDRNHPSIVIWSMGNETDHACDSRIAWEEDKTRIITVRQPYNDSYNPEFCPHTDSEMPVESYLRCTIRGWYDVDDRDLNPSDGQWAGTDAWQHFKSASGKARISEHNGTVWLYSDHGADREYTGAPLKHVNPKGWVDSWRTPKYVYYLWQANFAKKPMVFVQPHFWRSRYVGQSKDFVVDSNCSEVELFVNGASKGVLKPSVENNFTVTFENVKVEKGTLEVVGKHADGTKASDKVVMAGEPAALVARITSPAMMASTDNLGEVWVDIVDADGVHVYGADPTLRFSVDGPAKLVGPEIWVSDREKSEEYEGTMYIDVPVRNLVRSTGVPGKVTVTVSAQGLTPASVTFDVAPYKDPTPVAGIVEPRLSPEGRVPVAINTSVANFIKAPVEMKYYSGEVSFPIERKGEFRTMIGEFIAEQNPDMDVLSPEFEYMTGVFEEIMLSTAARTGTNGYLVADDYNFIAEQYNVVRAISKYIDGRDLPEAFKKELTDYYARQIIVAGKDRNYIAENEMIGRIPKGGTAVMMGENHPDDGSVICATGNDLPAILATVYPETASWKEDQIKKACTLICRINPYASYQSVRDRKTKRSTYVYSLTPGKIILIPAQKYLLKNSFPDKNL